MRRNENSSGGRTLSAFRWAGFRTRLERILPVRASVLVPSELELTGRASLLVRRAPVHAALRQRRATIKTWGRVSAPQGLETTSSPTPTGLNKTVRLHRCAIYAGQSTRRQSSTPKRCPHPGGITASSRRSAQRHLRDTPQSTPRPQTGSQRVSAPAVTTLAPLLQTVRFPNL